MKTINTFSFKVVAKICLSLSFLSITSCSKTIHEDLEFTDSMLNQETYNWTSSLEELNFESIIIANNENSISNAIKEAIPGDIILIQPGNYQENIILDKPDIRLFSLVGDNGEKVVLKDINGKIMNVEHLNTTEKKTVVNHQNKNRRCRILNITRTDLDYGIAHYQFEVKLGSGEFDVVRIHRVVRESRSYRPVKTKGEIFMVHGSGQDFDDIFLRPGVENATVQNSSPMYLAMNNVDVWGIDLGWTLVPAETSDFTFMKDWGVERDADHTLKAMAIARLIRVFTGQGFERLNLLGFSYSVNVAYAAAGKETQQHPILRDIKGIIATDGALKFAPEDEVSRQSACIGAMGAQEQINNGIYQNDGGIRFGVIGNLAISAPNEASPVIPGFTNYQAALFFGTSIFALGNPPAPFWHFTGGEFDENNIPIGMLYTNPNRWLKLLTSLAPYQPVLHGLETATASCNEQEVSFDDYLYEITVPIFYLGAGGGTGPQGLFTSSLTKSEDITNHIVSLQPENLRFIDFGHADLFMGENAADLVWDPLRQWLLEHDHR